MVNIDGTVIGNNKYNLFGIDYNYEWNQDDNNNYYS